MHFSVNPILGGMPELCRSKWKLCGSKYLIGGGLQMGNGNRKKTRSWGFISLMLYLFFPVGIYMMVKKVTTEKHNYIKNGKALKAFGWVSLVLGTIILVVNPEVEPAEKQGDLYMVIVFFYAIAAFLFLSGRKYVKRGLRFERYAAIVYSGKIYNLEAIASAFPTDYKTACKDLQNMMDAGFFPSSYIDLERKMLITPETPPVHNATIMQNVLRAESPKAKVIKCPNCGATNAIYSEAVGICKYCDSLLDVNAANIRNK